MWANVIGLILVYLSIGYWFGGKLADRRPERALLGRIVLIAAAAIAVEATRDFLRDNDSISEVTFVVSTDEIESAYQRLLAS